MVDENTKLIDAIEKSMEFKLLNYYKRKMGEYGIITDSLLRKVGLER